jgi:hypothetical protein
MVATRKLALLPAVLAAGALLVPTISPASAARKRVCHKRVHGHLVKRRCPTRKPAPTVPVSTTLLTGSQATLDFGSGNVRTIPLSGKVTGYVPGVIRINSDTRVLLKGGKIVPAPTDIFTDACASPALARTNPASSIFIDPSKTSSATLHADGSVTADTHVIIRLALDERSACGQPAFATGYTDNPVAVPLSGHVQAGTGLSNLELDSPPYPLHVGGCTTAGDPAKPCAGAPTGYDSTASVRLFVKIGIGAGA